MNIPDISKENIFLELQGIDIFVKNSEKMEENPKEGGKVSIANNIVGLVKAEVKTGNEQVSKRVVSALVEQELERRTQLVLKALEKKETLEKELVKFKPDVVSYKEDNTVASESWSKANLDNKKKTADSLAKIDAAIEAAVSGNDYDKLAKALA